MPNFDKEYLDKDNINLLKIFQIISKKSKIVFSVSGIFFIASILYAFSIKKTWEGQFQIIIANKNDMGSSLAKQVNPSILNLVGAPVKNKINTEVEILRSPSILLPIFNIVKKEKSRINNKPYESYFREWRKSNLDINLQKGTSVLNIAYRDDNKELILKILKEISIAYQNYSGRDRQRGLSQGIEHLNKQIKIYEIKSNKSMRNQQSFAIENDLFIDLSLSKLMENPVTIPIEQDRIRYSNEIRLINEQLSRLNKEDVVLTNDVIVNILGILDQDIEIVNLIKNKDKKIALMKEIYKKNDKDLINAVKERNILFQLLNNELKSKLNAKKIILESKVNASKREKNILIAYKSLLNKSFQDSATLQRLISEREILSLEKERNEDPWELITKPTLLDFPVAPRKKVIAIFGLFLGSVLGLLLALISYKKDDLIFFIDEIESLVNQDLVLDLSNKNDKKQANLINLFSRDKKILKEAKIIEIIPVGEIDNQIIKNISNVFNKAFDLLKVKTIKDPLLISENSYTFLIIGKGISTKKQLKELSENLQISGKKIFSSIFLDPKEP